MDDAPLTEFLLPIVVGAHLRAELYDRRAADTLRQRMSRTLASIAPSSPLTPIVCTDLWYLNDDSLRLQPTVSVGSPGVNALSAYLADKLPSAFTVEGVLSVQLDLDMHELMACCWGADHESTALAAEAFEERYLRLFLEAAASAIA